ncbi:MAG: acetylornithine deacetylase [Alphaproteobacteria bacterium]|nr:acetylornithine deacetylase [Alphaproteobacteria bacterium]
MADGLISLELIESLIEFDTTSSESNLGLIEYVKRYLAGYGVESTLVYDDEKRKANLYATVGPTDRPGICLSGHTDVVPVEGQNWDSDPFQLRRADGKLFGRGTADMKSFIAIALAFVPQWVEHGLRTPVHLAFSYDEEVGHLGAKRLMEVLKDFPIKPAMCIVGEPTSLGVVIGHKGKKKVRVRVRGLEAHSSLTHKGVNAIEYAAKLISHMQDTAHRWQTEGPFDEDFDVPFCTMQVGVIRGGTAPNIVPKDCVFDLEIRHLPTVDPEALFDGIRRYALDVLQPEMHAVDPATGFDFDEFARNIALNTDPDDAVVTFVKGLAGQNDHSKVAFGTEAGLFQQRAGIPTVVCGPGDIAQAHKPNEYITLEQVRQGEAFMSRLSDYVRREQLLAAGF